MLGKAKKAIPNAAMSAETSGCATKEGILKKKNSKGEWKDRFCYFSNNFFLTYKPKGNGPSSELKESVDLKLTKTISNSLDVIEIVMQNGEKMEFKGSSVSEVQEWIEIMRARVDWATGRDSIGSGPRQRSGSSATASFPALEGFLFKKNSKGEWKRRFCACKSHAFVGYKENSSHEIKENVEYKDIVKVGIGKNEKGKSTIEIEVRGGEKIIFQTEKAKEWKEGLELRADAFAQLAVGQSPAQSPHKTLANSSSSIAINNLSEADLVSLEGILKKKNSKGEWKDRHCIFEKHFFKAFKTNRGKSTTECKESIDLKDIDTVDCIASDVMQIDLKQGETLLFKGSSVSQWMHALHTRMLFVQREYNNSLQENLLNTVHIEGFLMKKSHNKYQGLQERYVRVEGLSLKYYKEKDGKFTTPLGSIDLSKAEFVRPFSDAADCLIFEVHDEGDKTYKFQASSHKEMAHWVATCDKLLCAQRERIETMNRDKIAKETPLRVKWFDEQGEEYWLTEIRGDFESMYADPQTTEMTIKDHLDFANEVVGYLTDFVPEVQRCDTRPARFDILALMLTEVNAFLTKRLCTFLPIGQQADEDEERSDLLENANLGDLHAILNWITGYQATLRGIRCPVCGKDSPATTPSTVLSTKYLTPKQCAILDCIPSICRLFVYGGSVGAKGGASVTLFEHCLRVWNNCIAHPEEMLQRRNDGTFFTHTPIDMWESINLHISLATSTRTPILHVMIADKIVSTLNSLFDKMIRYINTVDSSQNPALREVELEFFSALANDTALHIEEVVNLIDQFDIEEIRQKIDDIFDPLTTNLVNCGQACLSRLARLVISDVQGQMDEVFQEEWMEGNQMHVVTATVTDYMSDFEDYLVPFWSEKFLTTIFEEVIVAYTRSLLFRKSYGTTSTISSTAQSEGGGESDKSGFMSSIFQKTKQAAQTMVTTVYTPTHVHVDAEALGRLAQDVNILNSFFSQKAGQEKATEFLVIINEVSLLLFVDMDGLVAHMEKCAQAFPSALAAVKEVALATMKLRPDEFNKQDVERFNSIVQPMLLQSVRDAAEKEEQGIAEEKLGLLYMEIVPKHLLKSTDDRLSLAQRNKLMSNVRLGNTQRVIKNDDDDDHDDDDPSSQLLDDVIGVLQQIDEEDVEFINEKEEAEREKEMQKNKIGMLKYDGDLDKKSPAHNLWQKRYFKLVTRETHVDEKPYIYSFMWYKKQGGSVIKALDVDQILSLAVVQTQRPLVFVPMLKNSLMLKIEAGSDPTAVPVQPLEQIENASAKNAGLETYIFMVTQQDGKEHILKSSKVDRILKWMNLLALAGGLAYDPHTHQWTRNMMSVYAEKAAERAKLQSFQNVAATPLAPFGGSEKDRERARSSSSVGSIPLPPIATSSPQVQHDNEGAAALIAAMRQREKEEENEKERQKEIEREKEIERQKELQSAQEEQEARERAEQQRLRTLEEEEQREKERIQREEAQRLQKEQEKRAREDRERQERAMQEEMEKDRHKQLLKKQELETTNPIPAKAKSNAVDSVNPLRRLPPTPPPPQPVPAPAPPVSSSSSSSPPPASTAGGRKTVLSKRLGKARRAPSGGATADAQESSPGTTETDSAETSETTASPAAKSSSSSSKTNETPSKQTVSAVAKSADAPMNQGSSGPKPLSPPTPTVAAKATATAESPRDAAKIDVVHVAQVEPVKAKPDEDDDEDEGNASEDDGEDDDDSSAGAGSDDDDVDKVEPEDPAVVAKRERDNAFLVRLDECFPDEDAPLRKQIGFAVDCLALWQSSSEKDLLRETFLEFLTLRLQDSLSVGRSENMDEASLSEILSAIQFLVSLQQQMREAVAADGTGRESLSDESRIALCDQIPTLCKLYLMGGTAGARGGVSAQLQDGGLRLWTAITQNPDAQLTKVDGLPSLGLSVCEMIDKALQEVNALSASDVAAKLQAQVRDMARSALRQLLDAMAAFVSNADFSLKYSDPTTKYHLLCAVLNDIERDGGKLEHILEEEADFVSQKMQLLRTVLLPRLSALCVGESVAHFDQIFLPQWLTEEDEDMEDSEEETDDVGAGGIVVEHPTRKALRILDERLTFCKEIVNAKHKEALVNMVLENVVVQFVKSLLFRRNISNPPPLNQKTGFFSGMYQKAKQALLPPHVHVNAESMGRLTMDIKLVNSLLVTHDGPEVAAELLPVLNEVSFMLVVDFQGLVQHFGQASAESPRSTTALREVALATMRMRTNDFTKADIDKFSEVIAPLVENAGSATESTADRGLTRIGSLYNRIVKA